MQVTKNHISDTQVSINIVADVAEIATAKKKVLAIISKKTKLAGFRTGKAPAALIERNIDSKQLASDFIEECINSLYISAVSKEKYRVIGNPEISLKKFVPYTTLEFEVNINIIGEIILPDYKKMKFSRAIIKISSKDIDEVIESLRIRSSEKNEVDRPAKKGDEVLIDFKGVDSKGVAVDGAEANDYPLSLGSNIFIPGFEDNIIGMKLTQKKSFTLKFPKDYNVSALASKAVTFSVKVNKILDITLPAVDDKFASIVGPFKTLLELKEDIKVQLTIERNKSAEKDFESEIVRAITNKSVVSAPDLLVDNTMDQMVNAQKQNLTYRGQTFQEYLDTEGITVEKNRENMKTDALERVRASLVLAEIAEKENIGVDKAELATRMKLLREQYKDDAMQAELDKPEAANSVASSLLTEKTINYIKEHISR